MFKYEFQVSSQKKRKAQLFLKNYFFEPQLFLFSYLSFEKNELDDIQLYWFSFESNIK